MRLLIVSDSHGRGLDAIIHRNYKDWTVMTVWVGAQLSYVRSKYHDQMQEIYEFNPTCAVLHVGHNDIMYHPRHNETPQHIKYYFPEVVDFLHLLQGYHPLTRVFYSTIFPRSEGYEMSAVEKKKYNVLAGRFGVRAKSTCANEGIGFIQNSCLWESLRQCEESSEMISRGGLHLSKEGQIQVVKEWIGILTG
jgi:hypothetical protein